jgi:glycine/D-amino acid oxidase-like deaminating enzyme/nitrite reductase/ring-hydroxylating ferredoxin subunit
MEASSGQTRSVWLETARVPPRGALDRDIDADVCVIGGGLAGLTTAYLLSREGRSVIVLEDGEIGSGETGRTTAHLSNAVDDRYCELERLHGERGARLAAASHSAAIDRIERIVADEGIECGFLRLDGFLVLGPEQPPDLLQRELAAARRAGLTGVEACVEPALPTWQAPCLRFPRQAQFHPMRYLAGLARAFESRGGRVYTHTHVTAIEPGRRMLARTDHGFMVEAGAAVVATNTPINYRVAIHTKQAAYRTYVIGLQIPHGSVRPALFWDTLDPYHYVRLTDADGGELLVVGGEDHKTGQEQDIAARYARLEAWARARFPMAETVQYQWSGQVMEPVDGVAFIGRDSGTPNLYVATGDSGMGMTHATIAGILLTDLIAGRENEWAALYDPGRVTLRATGEFVRENLNVAAQYTDLVSGGDVESADSVARGSGAVIRRGTTKVAIYRDADGRVHEMSAICPHLGCVVAWNPGERTWDCPCHGSRFDACGRVVNGPANSDLEPVT